MILAGDIGGTNARLALFRTNSPVSKPLRENIFPTKQYASLIKVLDAFIGEHREDVTAVCIAAAGPHIDDAIEVTNLPWVIRLKDLEEYFAGIPIRLANDLESLSSYVPYLEQQDLHTLNQGNQLQNHPIAIVAPGTGLGEGYLIPGKGGDYFAFPTEGGHTGFSPSNQLQIKLLEFLHKKYEHVSVERICSGIGILNIFDFLVHENYFPDEPVKRIQKIKNADDPVPVIFSAAVDKNDPSSLCNEVINIFVDVLGLEAGNLGLQFLSKSGIYIGGGIPPRIVNFLEKRFMQTFLNKGRMTHLLEDMPVHIILHESPALYGAAYLAMDLVSRANLEL